jgi:hypothetical protein
VANFHYFHPDDNVAPNATPTVETGTANASYPVANSTLLSYAKIAAPSKLAEVTGAWLFDFGSAQRVDAVVLWHNFDAGITCKLQGNATNSWGGPTVDATLTIPAKRSDDFTVKVYRDLTGVTGYSASGFRYWRLTVTGNSVPVGIKILLFSQIRTTSKNFQWSYAANEHQTAIQMTTDALVPWAYDLTAAPRQFVGTVPGTDADATKIAEWFRACAGPVHPTVIVPNPSENDAWLCRWSSGQTGAIAPSAATMRLEAVRRFTNVNFRQLVFDEITAGDPEWD